MREKPESNDTDKYPPGRCEREPIRVVKVVIKRKFRHGQKEKKSDMGLVNASFFFILFFYPLSVEQKEELVITDGSFEGRHFDWYAK
ncbi:hypothetical protein NPIL_165001 [Nephila pilipes]|uniref:Uncharacterized protein n=1 Tax=Nephila pilipes TaxID=299642 RepID=A0A8X6NWN3_NEPPI|nr:hypothetical protein NPIL_165001 [Nephila pilipes]